MDAVEIFSALILLAGIRNDFEPADKHTTLNNKVLAMMDRYVDGATDGYILLSSTTSYYTFFLS